MSSNFDESEKSVLPANTGTENQQQIEDFIVWEAPKKPTVAWRFWVPLLLQTVLIATVPAQAVYTHLTGKTVILQTMPVDPYDLLRGYSQTLSYDISQDNTLKKLPGWQDLPGYTTPCPPVKPSAKNTCTPERYVNSNTTIYVTLEAPKSQPSSNKIPSAWKPLRVSAKPPKNLPANQVAIQGKYRGFRVDYGLETYYMPEDQRDKINQEINQLRSLQSGQNRQKQPFVVEVKVNSQGKAVPVSLWLQDRNYRF